jgi:cell division topological specificity factor
MGILDFLKRKPEATATVARERLRIIVAQERSTRGAPDYLPMMRNELLEVIKKYVHVDLDAININVERDSGHEILELSVTLPEGKQGSKDESKGEAQKTG